MFVSKRIVDILVSLTALVILAPFMALIAVAICLNSSGSPIFSQTRVGKDCRPFQIYKFRSMVKDAPKLGTFQTADNDPRITSVGRFLRFTSLDELPQIWNVFIGNMSLVGPRPMVPVQESQYQPEDWKKRHLVKPGITGLSQVSGRSTLTLEEQVHFDTAYVQNPSLWQDMKILLKTIDIVLRRVGVN